jgi:riboflavin biosynthesis pyrimidine reductase
MKLHVICHMGSSVDGRSLPGRWRPKGAQVAGLYERLHDELKGDAWLVGRVTGQEFSKRSTYPSEVSETYAREPWIARRDASAYGIVVDAQGKIAWGRSEIGGDPLVVVLTEQVPDAHLAALRADGVSYVFAGKQEIDLSRALDVLNRELGSKRLLLEGGGSINGGFLRAGLVDEISLIIYPAVDGSTGAPSVFDSSGDEAGTPAPIQSLTLKSSQALQGGAVWLRYEVRNSW